MLIDGDVSYHHLIAWAVEDQLKADDVFFWPFASFGGRLLFVAMQT
jgi:hypothetical protein